MKLDVTDTIVAIASARGAAERGVVRLSGPDAVALASSLSAEPITADKSTRLAGHALRCPVGDAERPVPADLYVWPDERSYTRQPSVEVHTVGAPPVLDAVVQALLAAGARLAEPGEFTLRALLAGRLDLPQAEAVLAVIDAASGERLESALTQLAGGLSTPLHRLRGELLGLLADLEAGLDFVEEEDVRFIEPDVLRRRLAEAAERVAAAQRRLATRDDTRRLPRVVIAGPPNVGKSRLFNALVDRFGAAGERPRALVADQPGVTRDALAATLQHGGARFVLVDTAGADERAAVDAIDAAARERLAAVYRDAELLLECRPAGEAFGSPPVAALGVATMSDRTNASTTDEWLATSAATGEGLGELVAQIARRLAESGGESAGGVDDTARRSRASLGAARDALSRAAHAAATNAGEEVVSLEVREALDALGRVVGEVVTDEVLGEIFGKFCIGK